MSVSPLAVRPIAASKLTLRHNQNPAPMVNRDSPPASPVRGVRPSHIKKTSDLMKNPQGPPLDYSFLEIKQIEELREVMPRSGYRKQPPETIDDMPNPLREEWVPPPREDMTTHGLKLSNNMITSLTVSSALFLKEVMDIRALKWIDLSFNSLEEVPQGLTALKNLSVIYLHANRIHKLSSLKHIIEHMSLRSLTLHGNPCEQIKHYRLFVLGMLKTIRTLDFTAVTTIDREKAETFYSRHERNKERRKNGD